MFSQQYVEAFNAEPEGRVKLGSFYIPSSPAGYKDFNSDAELKFGLSGNNTPVWIERCLDFMKIIHQYGLKVRIF